MAKRKFQVTNESMVCHSCGGTNIEVKVWADYYTDRVLDDTGDDDDSTRWCRDCESHVDFITYKEFLDSREQILDNGEVRDV